MRKLLLMTTAMLALSALPAKADIIDDPLHGMTCTGLGTGCSNAADNGSFTPIGGAASFGFTISPGPATGNLDLVFLVPTNQINVTTFNLTGLSENNVSISPTVFSRANLLTVANGDSIAAYLGVPNAASYSPTDNFANASAGEILNPGFTGSFLAFTLMLNGITLGDVSSTTLANFFTGNNLPLGTVVLGLFEETSGPHPGSFVGTAASADLVVSQTSAVPGPIVGAGLPGLITACMMMLGLGRYRRQRRDMGVVA